VLDHVLEGLEAGDDVEGIIRESVEIEPSTNSRFSRS